MRKYLAPNDTHQITVPIIVGAEYAVPTGDGKLTVRTSGVDSDSIVPQQDATEVTIEVITPSVAAGQLKIVNYLLSIPTAIGRFQTLVMPDLCGRYVLYCKRLAGMRIPASAVRRPRYRTGCNSRDQARPCPLPLTPNG